jgi:hypothetical protein
MSLSTVTRSRIHLTPAGITSDINTNQRELLDNSVYSLWSQTAETIRSFWVLPPILIEVEEESSFLNLLLSVVTHSRDILELVGITSSLDRN